MIGGVCPECKTHDTYGLYGPRYCPDCGWEENSE